MNTCNVFCMMGPFFQALRRRPALLPVLMSAVLLSACEEGKGSDPAAAMSGVFQLRAPSEGGVVLDAETSELIISYYGAARRYPDNNLALELNGVDITSYPLRFSDANGLIRGPLSALADVLLVGENTIVVSNTDTGYSETLTFFYDGEAPRLEVTSVTGGTGANGEPQAGDLVTIEGRIVDPSDITGVSFRTSAGTVNLLPQGVLPLTGNQFSNTPDGNGDKTFRVELEYPDIAPATELPHFTYTVRDIHDQERTESFFASASTIAKSMAVQVNVSLFDQLRPLVNAMVESGVNLAESQAILPGLLSPAINDYAPAFCGVVVNAQYCAGAVEGVDLVNPRLAANALDRNGYVAQFGVTMDDIYVSIRIDGYNSCAVWPTSTPAVDCTGVGSFRTTIKLSDFVLYSNFRVQPGLAGSKVVDIERTPVALYLNPLWHGLNKQATLMNSRCSSASACVIDPVLLEFAYNLRLTADGRELAGDILQAIADGVEAVVSAPNGDGKTIDDLLEEALPTLPQLLVTPAVPTDRVIESRLAVSNVFAQRAHPVNPEPRNGHLRFQGGFAVPALSFDADYAPANGGLGSLFRPQGNYDAMNGAYYPSKLPGGQGPQIDLALAISANTVNQYLLAEHQAGTWKEKTVDLVDVDLSGVAIAEGLLDSQDDPASTFTNDVRLRFATGDVPRAHFTGYKSTRAGFKFELVGVGEVGTIKEDTPGNIRFDFPAMQLFVTDLTETQDVMQVVADVSVHLSFDLVNGWPQIKPFDRFVTVTVRELTVDPLFAAGQQRGEAGIVLKSLLGDYIEAQLQAFNQPQGKWLDANNDIFNNAQLCADPNNPTPATCINYGDMMGSALPREFGLVFRSFGIEPSGAYFTLMADMVNQKLGGFICPRGAAPNEYQPASYFRAWCIEQ